MMCFMAEPGNRSKEQVDKWFEEALQMVDEDCIIGHWFGTPYPVTSHSAIS